MKSKLTGQQFLEQRLTDIPLDIADQIRLQHEKLKDKEKMVLIIERLLDIAKKHQWQIMRNEGNFYVYVGTHWQKISDDVIISFICDVAIRMGFKETSVRHYSFREGLLKQFQIAGLRIFEIEENNVVKINFKNGTLHFKCNAELEFKDHDLEDGLRYVLNFDYLPGEESPMFKDYLNRVLPNPCKQLPLAEFIGYAFSGLKLEKCLVLYGSGANGKSVFFDIIIALLGVENISNFSLQSLTDNNGYTRANLSGKLINYSSELSSKMNTSFFKMLVSGEPIEARQIYGKPFLLRQVPKLIFNTNELPFDIEQNDGFYRRFLLIHFDQTIPESERDAELAQKIISSELPGVLNWVLEGLQRITVNKQFSPCDDVNRALDQFREDHDPIRLFLSDIQAMPQHPELSKMQLKLLYARYIDYCKEYGYRSCSLQAFSKRIQAIGYTVKRASHGRDVGIYVPTVLSTKSYMSMPRLMASECHDAGDADIIYNN